MFAWEAPFIKKILAAREKELECMKKLINLDAFSLTSFFYLLAIPLTLLRMWFAGPFLLSGVSLSVYQFWGNEVTLDIILTVLATSNVARLPMQNMPWYVPKFFCVAARS